MSVTTAIALALVAMLYASVGHGGASGYLAVLTLAGYPSEHVRATALTLNIVVSFIALIQFTRHGGLRLDLLVPFALTAVPSAFFAGRYLALDDRTYRVAIGLVLGYAAWRLACDRAGSPDEPPRQLPRGVALGAGALIGVVSGLIGVGGGIFLSPLLILMRWSTAREAAGVSAAFILLASVAGLLGLALHHGSVPVHSDDLAIFAACAAGGGVLGASLGAGQFKAMLLRRMLSLVMLIAAAKLCLT
jgi:uncharacterized membrane protein YfcA